MTYAHLIREANLIDGLWVPADGGKTIDVTNPATGAVIARVPNAGTAETKRAIAAAHAAFPAYAALALNDRVALMRKLHQAIMDNLEGLAGLLTAEQGKPLAESWGEVASSAAYVLWFAEEARRTDGAVIPSPVNGRKLMTTRHPVGVVAAITPWNFPSSMLARKLGPALAAGCTVVVKPASATPLSGLVWGHLAEQVGFPKGVVNILTGSAREIGGEITANPQVRKITFTGSTAIGKQILAEAAATVKRVSMELGGNAPFIVFDDADLDAAVEGAMISKFRNNGQTCVCANRIYVQAGVYDAFAEKLTKAVAKLNIGDGLTAGVTTGPLITMAAMEKVEEHIADVVAGGGKVVMGGHRHKLGGLFFEPTVVTGVTPQMKVSTEETFGPLAPLFKFDTEEEVIHLANDTIFGLASYFYARDIGRITRVQEALEYGMVGVNTGLISTEVAPFGGVKQSGLGREGSHHGIDDYLEMKYICLSI